MRRSWRTLEAHIAELTATEPEVFLAKDLSSMQSQLEGMHDSKLITDEELYAIEDLVVDYAELRSSLAGKAITEQMIYSSPGITFGGASKLHKMIGMSTMMPSDVGFARQIRRKFL